MNYLLFTVFFLMLCWVLVRIPFATNSGISKNTLLALFFCKIAAGIAIGWISLHLYGSGNDYWDINREAWNEYRLMLTDPGKYLVNLFTSDYPQGYSGMFGHADSYWNDLKGNILIKLVSLFNIFSRGDYYVNSLFFNFIIFFGHLLFYRVFIRLYPQKQVWVMIGCFLLPSTLYFSSGIHKDGLVFLLLALFIFSVFQSLYKGIFSVKRLVIALLSLALLFFIRSFVCLALLPAALAWVIAAKSKWKPWIVFGATYLLAILFFFSIGPLTGGRVDPLQVIVQRQADYLSLTGSDTPIALTVLEPGFRSFLNNAPQALAHVLLRPYLWELPTLSLLPLNIELLLYQLLFILFVLFRRKEPANSNPSFLFFGAFFVLSAFLLIGYIVPNLGSLVRYRAIYLPLVITPFLCQVDWQKFKTLKII